MTTEFYYLNQICSESPLSKEAENELLRQYHEEGNQKARERLITSNMRLVASIAKKYESQSQLSYMDLVQEGSIGLMTAIDKFELEKGLKLSTYATYWIRQTIGRAIANKDNTVRLPSHVREKQNRINGAIKSLTQSLSREPTSEEIGKEIGMPSDKVEFYNSTSKSLISLDETIDEKNGVTKELVDTIEDIEAPSPYAELMEHNNQEVLNTVLQDLTDVERKIVTLRFGLEGTSAHTLDEIGQECGFTRERARQLLNKALTKLRNPLRLQYIKDNYYREGENYVE